VNLGFLPELGFSSKLCDYWREIELEVGFCESRFPFRTWVYSRVL
jgi:hypothetical protein